MCSRPGPRSSRSTKASPRTISVVVAAVRPASRVPPKTVSTRKKERIEPSAVARPGGDREGCQRPQQAAAVERAVGGSEGQHEGGDPDRQEAGQGQVAGEEGEGEAGDRDEQDQRRRVDRLGQVEAAEAVDVAGDPPAFGDRFGQPGELVVEEDDVGDAFGHLRAGAHRHREPRLLQRRHVVDAVADHRRVAARLRAARRPALSSAPARSGRRSCCAARPGPAARGRRAGPGPRPCPASSGIPTAPATAVTVARASPEISFRSTSCSRMKAIVSEASGRSVSSSTTSASAVSRGGPSAGDRRAGARPDSPKATTRRPAAVSSSSVRCSPGGRVRAPALAGCRGRP